jgi:hypothetical protein
MLPGLDLLLITTAASAQLRHGTVVVFSVSRQLVLVAADN